jgi:hypothetical protein
MAEFEVLLGSQLLIGVARLPGQPGLTDLDLSKRAHMTKQFWGINGNGGKLHHDGRFNDWLEVKDGDKRVPGFGAGDTVGLILDCDEGTLTVYKNGELLGACLQHSVRLQKETLCWAVSLCGVCAATGLPMAQPVGQSVRIAAKVPPTK